MRFLPIFCIYLYIYADFLETKKQQTEKSRGLLPYIDFVSDKGDLEGRGRICALARGKSHLSPSEITFS